MNPVARITPAANALTRKWGPLLGFNAETFLSKRGREIPRALEIKIEAIAMILNLSASVLFWSLYSVWHVHFARVKVGWHRMERYTMGISMFE